MRASALLLAPAAVYAFSNTSVNEDIISLRRGQMLNFAPCDTSNSDWVLAEYSDGSIQTFQPYKAGNNNCTRAEPSSTLRLSFGEEVPSGDIQLSFPCAVERQRMFITPETSLTMANTSVVALCSDDPSVADLVQSASISQSPWQTSSLQAVLQTSLPSDALQLSVTAASSLASVVANSSPTSAMAGPSLTSMMPDPSLASTLAGSSLASQDTSLFQTSLTQGALSSQNAVSDQMSLTGSLSATSLQSWSGPQYSFSPLTTLITSTSPIFGLTSTNSASLSPGPSSTLSVYSGSLDPESASVSGCTCRPSVS